MSSIITKFKKGIKTGDLAYKIICSLWMLLGFSNESIMRLEVENKVYKKIKNKTWNSLNNTYKEPSHTTKQDNNIWVCWMQGEEQAPAIVKTCINSIRKNASNHKVIIIDKRNYTNYISLPEYIVKKWESGIISDAHFSDILRTALLSEHGGVWIDSTVYLMDKIPDYILEKDLFLFNYEDSKIMFKYNNWFIASNKNNPVMLSMRDLLYEFWKKNNKPKNYFIWHMLFNIVIDKYNYPITYIPNSIGHLLVKIINDNYNDKDYALIKHICPIQKLSYRIEKNSNDNTYYSYIIGENR